MLSAHCDKGIGYARLTDLETTAADVRRGVDQAIDEGIRFKRITLSGGEPIVSKELQGVVNEIARMPGMQWCRVLSNGLNATQERRDAIQFPDERFDWVINPLDDPSDPKSGKNKREARRYRRRIHTPYWISPVDHGMEGTFQNCSVRKFCGRGFDSHGYSMCGQAPILGRILGINPYCGQHIVERIYTPIPEICRHCIYGLSIVDSSKLSSAAARGEISSVSPTYAKIFGGDPYGVSPELPQPTRLVQLTLS